MKRTFVALMLSFALIASKPAKADLFGGDVAVLVQILAQAIKQLVELKKIVDTGTDNLNLVKDINRGINDSLNLLQTIYPNIDPGLYEDWAKVADAMKKLEGIYGIVFPSKDQKMQKDADQSAAEAVSLNNSIYDYTKQIDQIGEQIKNQSHHVSPGGAQKLSAQTLGVMLHVLNQSLRTQATGLKLQAQNLMIQNHKDKELTRHKLETSRVLKTAMTSTEPKFSIPRF